MAGGSTDGGIGNDGGSGTSNSISTMMSGHGEISNEQRFLLLLTLRTLADQSSLELDG